MRVGIATDYGQSEATYAALDLAALCSDWGLAPKLFPLTETHLAVSSVWDSRIKHQNDFVKFAKTIDCLVWTSCGHPDRLLWCHKHNIRSYYVPLWHEFDPGLAEVYALYNAVVTPFKAVARVLRDQYGLSNVFDCAWSPARAMFQKPPNVNQRLRLLVPVEGERAGTVPLEICAQLGQMMARTDKLDVTLLVSCWNGAARRRLGALTKQFPSRTFKQRMPVYEEFPELAFRHDLVFFPSLCESLGSLALRSLHCGLPVVAWEMAPIKEFVETRRNGMLISGGTKRDECGYSYADEPDWATAADVIVGLAETPAQMAQLQAETPRKLARRRQTFERVWESLFKV